MSFSLNSIFNYSKKNSSVLILAISTVSFLLLNIFFKSKINPDDYGRIALLLTYISLLYSFGLFGSEQLLIRRCVVDVQSKKIIIDSNARFIIAICLFAQLIFPLGYHLFYKFENLFLGILLSIAVTASMLTYNIFRVAGRLNMSQFSNGAWKIISLSAAVFFIQFSFIKEYQKIELLFFSILVFTSVFFLIACLKIVRFDTIQLKKSEIQNDFRLLSNFFYSLLFASLLAQGDRLLISTVNNNLTYIGEYLFLGTVIVSPFNFLQSYFGFKYLSDYKVSTNHFSLLKKNVGEVTIVNLIFIPAVVVVLLILLKFKILDYQFFNDHIVVAVFMFLIGVTRMYYSIFSSIMGSMASIKRIRLANFNSILSFLIGITVFYFFPSVLSLTMVFFFLWLARLFIWYYHSIHSFYEFKI